MVDVQRDALVARSQLIQRPAEQFAPAASTTGSARRPERSLLNLSAKTFGRVPLTTAIIRRCDARCEHCLRPLKYDANLSARPVTRRVPLT